MFLNAIMLAGIAGAAVPLVLHLLSRARYRSIDWGAMMFLVGADQKQRQSTRLKQWILLALRMAIVAVLAIAMARPIVSGLLRSFAPGGHVDVALAIDCSASMAVEENGKSRMELARRAAIAVISQLQRGDRVALVISGATAPPPMLSSDLQAVAQAVSSLSPGDGRMDVALALSQAADILDTGDSLNREIYLIGDRQATSWSGVDEGFATAIAHRFAAATHVPRLFYLLVGGEEHRNIAIESFTAQGLPAVAKQPLELEVRLRNFGDETVADLPLSITEGQKELYRNSVVVPAGAATVIRASVQFDSPGCPVLTAQIKPDTLPFDDRRDLSILVAPPLEVLFISGNEREGLFRKESDFPRLALSPYAASNEQGPDPCRVTIISPAKWQRPDPRKYPIVVLANVSSLTEAQVSELEQYVYSGGGLLVTAGNLMQAESYNALLYRDGAGILPAKLGDSMSSKATTLMNIIGVEMNHPVFRFLRGKPDPVPSAMVTRHMPVETSRSDARILMTLNDGEPLLLERPAGRGKAILLTTTISAEWNTLPLSGFYLPMMQSLARYLAASQLPEMNVREGEAISLNVDGIAEDTPPKIKRPDGTEDTMELRPSVLSSELRYTKTQQSGRYELKLKVGNDQRTWTFTSQQPSEESNLASLSSDRLGQLRSALDMQILDARSDELSGTVGAGRAGREMWLPLATLALILLAIETWFARYCSSTNTPS